MNVRTSPVLLEEIDMIVRQGLFRNRTEAVNEALRILIRRYKVMKVAERMDSIAKKGKAGKDLASILAESREEEDR